MGRHAQQDCRLDVGRELGQGGFWRVLSHAVGEGVAAMSKADRRLAAETLFARLNPCRKCGATNNERCYHKHLGTKVYWDEAVHYQRRMDLTAK